jgi:hypothetical protein
MRDPRTNPAIGDILAVDKAEGRLRFTICAVNAETVRYRTSWSPPTVAPERRCDPVLLSEYRRWMKDALVLHVAPLVCTSCGGHRDAHDGPRDQGSCSYCSACCYAYGDEYDQEPERYYRPGTLALAHAIDELTGGVEASFVDEAGGPIGFAWQVYVSGCCCDGPEDPDWLCLGCEGAIVLRELGAAGIRDPFAPRGGPRA